MILRLFDRQRRKSLFCLPATTYLAGSHTQQPSRYFFLSDWPIRAGVVLCLVSITTALFIGGCGYRISARPSLPQGLETVFVSVFENDTSETELGVLLANALAARIDRDGRLTNPSRTDARLLGKVEFIRASPVAFPAGTRGAGMYTISLRVSLRLIPSGGGSSIMDFSVTNQEHYLAGRTPEETESYRRLALDRLSERIAEDVWSRLTAPSL